MKVTTQSYGSKIFNSFAGAIIGIILFLGSFVVLYINEGRENLSIIADEAKIVTEANKGDIAYIEGNLDADVYATDAYLATDNYIFIDRNVEMYAYVETEHNEKHDNVGGSTTTITTYTYNLEWTASPKNSTSFQGDSNELPVNIPSDYNNWISSKPLSTNTKASGLSIGEYNLDDSIFISGKTSLALTTENIDLSELKNSTVSRQYIYAGNQENISATTPKIGDIRISYSVVKNDVEGIAFGKKDNNSLSSYTTEKGNELYRFFGETTTKDGAVNLLDTEHKTTTWIFRLIGWLLMFIGLLLISGPVSNVLSVIPIFSKFSRLIFGLIALVVSLVFSALTIIISVVLHNFWAAIIIIAIIIIITVVVLSRKRKNAINRQYR